jgi:hypothetical protein
MKRKYRRFTQNHRYALALVHKAAGGVKTYIREVLDFRRGHKKYDFSRKVFHSKFDVVLEEFLDIRRARRLIRNPALFDEHFNHEMRILAAMIILAARIKPLKRKEDADLMEFYFNRLQCVEIKALAKKLKLEGV